MQYRLIKALNRQVVDRPPIWLMRQAGRYLPEYRATRERAGSFLNLCKTPELAAEVTLQPLRRFALDAAIIFSDILVLADAMGLNLQMLPNEGPCFQYPIRELAEINKLQKIEPELDLGYVLAAIKLVKQQLNGQVPLIGFAGSPWTVATYMIEGKTSKNFYYIRAMLYQQANNLHKILELLTYNTTQYLIAQIIAGIDVVMLFDTWGGILSLDKFKDFSLKYLHKIIMDIKKLYPAIPIIVFCKDAGRSALLLSEIGVAAIGLDWQANLPEVFNLVGEKVAVQGNLDPALLYADTKVIKNEITSLLARINYKKGYIFNLGHGISPDIEPSKISCLVDHIFSVSSRAQ